MTTRLHIGFLFSVDTETHRAISPPVETPRSRLQNHLVENRFQSAAAISSPALPAGLIARVSSAALQTGAFYKNCWRRLGRALLQKSVLNVKLESGIEVATKDIEPETGAAWSIESPPNRHGAES
jgi:hypothetical protein